MWKSLHAAAFYTPGSPLHGASRQHWGQLVRLARPACSQRTAARRRSAGQRAPSENPRHSLWNARDFLFLFNGGHTGKALPISTSAAAEGGKLSLYGLLAGAGSLLTDPLVSGAPHRANRPHLKIPGTHSGMPGSFLFRFDGRHAGETLPISTAAAAKGGKLSLYRLLPGADGLLTDPLVSGALPQGGAAPGKLPHPKSLALALECRGFFIYL